MIEYSALIITAYVIIINFVACFAYYMDKRFAEKKKRRISEFKLLLFGAIGGSIGSLIGMILFHHKTRHWKFRILVPLFIIVHFVILVLIF